MNSLASLSVIQAIREFATSSAGRHDVSRSVLDYAGVALSIIIVGLVILWCGTLLRHPREHEPTHIKRSILD